MTTDKHHDIILDDLPKKFGGSDIDLSPHSLDVRGIMVLWNNRRQDKAVIINSTTKALSLRSGRVCPPGELVWFDDPDPRTEIVLTIGNQTGIVGNYYNQNGPEYWSLFAGGFPFESTWSKTPETCIHKGLRLLAEWQAKADKMAERKAARQAAEKVFAEVAAMEPLPILTHTAEDIFICGPNSHNRIPGHYQVGDRHFKWWDNARLWQNKGRRIKVAAMLRKLAPEVRQHLEFSCKMDDYPPGLRFMLRLLPLAEEWRDEAWLPKADAPKLSWYDGAKRSDAACWLEPVPEGPREFLVKWLGKQITLL